MKVRRLPVIDEYVEDGRSAVLVQGRVLALSEVGTSVLGLLDDSWTDMDRLVADLEAEVGAPEGMSVADALVPVLDELVTHELLERDDPDAETGA